MNSEFMMADEVRQAMEAHKAVVALESALITHGLAYPTNLECALMLEEAVREEGATLTTIAVVDGQVHLGLSREALERLASDESAIKVSNRNLPGALAKMQTGGTTVAATIWAAKKAGIKVMATGGIGGIHRETSFDVSADLPALASTPIVVVCAGAKAILDLPATREWLETYSVPIVGYRTEELPAFYSRESGLSVDIRCDTSEEIAQVFQAHLSLEFQTALVVVNPPPEKSALPRIAVEAAIGQAMEEMQERQIAGAEVTPFLLKRVGELTGGESVQTNLALLESNARLAALIAQALIK